MITHCPLLPARPHDSQLLDTLVEGVAGLAPADKGVIDVVRQTLLAERHGDVVITPTRKRMQPQPPPAVVRASQRWRKRLETVGSQLTERFAVARMCVHDLWHLQHRVFRKILAHTVVVLLNLQLGRLPRDLDGLVTA